MCTPGPSRPERSLTDALQLIERDGPQSARAGVVRFAKERQPSLLARETRRCRTITGVDAALKRPSLRTDPPCCPLVTYDGLLPVLLRGGGQTAPPPLASIARRLLSRWSLAGVAHWGPSTAPCRIWYSKLHSFDTLLLFSVEAALFAHRQNGRPREVARLVAVVPADGDGRSSLGAVTPRSCAVAEEWTGKPLSSPGGPSAGVGRGPRRDRVVSPLSSPGAVGTPISIPFRCPGEGRGASR